jgi:hypothetical protein
MGRLSRRTDCRPGTSAPRHVDEDIRPEVGVASSRTRTRLPGSALSRFASAHPADPPPTMMKSYRVLVIVPRSGTEGWLLRNAKHFPSIATECSLGTVSVKGR